MNRFEIAKIFWQIGDVSISFNLSIYVSFFIIIIFLKHQICNALFASKLLKSMSKRLKDLEVELNEYAV
jgi:hypothetical protein